MDNTKINLSVPTVGNTTKKNPLSPNSPITPITPITPVTPTTPNTSSLYSAINEIHEEYKKNEEILSIMKQIGFHTASKLSDTLQGMVWKATKTNKYGKMESSVIKITNQFLHQNSTAVIQNKLYRVSENILLEKDILKYLTEDKHSSDCIVKYKAFLQTNDDYWLVMSDGGSSLFEFVSKTHKLIKAGVIDISNYKQLVTVIFQQMIECISYIHSKKVAHYDISLENFLINDVGIAVTSDSKNSEVQKIAFDTKDVEIKLCDFGLAHKFTKTDFVSNKYCGKTAYKSPEVYNQNVLFDARKNDIWCLGVSLFILLTGGIPWNAARESDNAFKFVQKNSILQLLKYWNIEECMDKHFVFLLDSIFLYENERMSLADIQKYFYKFVWNV